MEYHWSRCAEGSRRVTSGAEGSSGILLRSLPLPPVCSPISCRFIALSLNSPSIGWVPPVGGFIPRMLCSASGCLCDVCCCQVEKVEGKISVLRSVVSTLKPLGWGSAKGGWIQLFRHVERGCVPWRTRVSCVLTWRWSAVSCSADVGVQIEIQAFPFRPVRFWQFSVHLRNRFISENTNYLPRTRNCRVFQEKVDLFGSLKSFKQTFRPSPVGLGSVRCLWSFSFIFNIFGFYHDVRRNKLKGRKKKEWSQHRSF